MVLIIPIEKLCVISRKAFQRDIVGIDQMAEVSIEVECESKVERGPHFMATRGRLGGFGRLGLRRCLMILGGGVAVTAALFLVSRLLGFLSW